MKKMLKLLTIGLCLCWWSAATASTFLDKTSLDQLGYRTLEPGQVTWNEEDGTAVLYIGSPTETKNLRAVDPAALRGYRYKVIDQELTFNCSNNMEDLGNGKFRWKSLANNGPMKYLYDKIEHNTKVTATDIICTLDPNTGDYIVQPFPEGTEINVEEAVETYYKKIGYWEATVEIISKDSAIQALDYTYTQVQGGFGDMDPIDTRRTVTYDGRKASLSIKITHASSVGHWCAVEGFKARCVGVGDIEDYVNDLTDGLNIKIKDKEGTYSLNDLRYQLIHKYDGNRGKDWSKYPAYQTTRMVDNALTWGYSYTNDNGTVETSNFGIGLTGKKKDQMAFSAGSVNFMRYIPANEAAVEGSAFAGTEIHITAIDWPSGTDSGCWEITFDCSRPVPQRYMQVLYRSSLENHDNIWQEITCVIEDISGGAQTTYRVIIPEVYGFPKMGFWKIGCSATAIYARMKIKATVSCLGSDGYMYKLVWPEGGGAVTAVRDDNED